MKHKSLAILAVLLLLALSTAPVFAGDEGHLYGRVFYDANLNGVWDVGEKPAPDVKVTLVSVGDTTVTLMSAPAADEIEDDTDNVCTYQDEDIPTPCSGTWGLFPAGGSGVWWKVSITVPTGYYVTSDNPKMVQAQAIDSTEVVEFGLAPIGAGGAGGATLPVTGVSAGLIAAGALLLSGLALVGGSRFRK